MVELLGLRRFAIRFICDTNRPFTLAIESLEYCILGLIGVYTRNKFSLDKDKFLLKDAV